MRERTVRVALVVGAALVVVGALAYAWWRAGPDDGERLAFQPSLVVYRKNGDGIERLHDGDRVDRGDLLQVEYIAAGRAFGVIASVDGDGRATLHHPAAVEAAPRLSSDGPQALDHAFELDDAARFERFVFVTGDRPIDVADVLDAAAATARAADPRHAPLEVERGLEQWSIAFEKAR